MLTILTRHNEFGYISVFIDSKDSLPAHIQLIDNTNRWESTGKITRRGYIGILPRRDSLIIETPPGEVIGIIRSKDKDTPLPATISGRLGRLFPQ